MILLVAIIPFEYEFNTKINEKISINANLTLIKKFLKVIVSYQNKETLFLLKVSGLSVIRKKIKKSNKIRKKENLKSKKASFNIMDYIQKEFINDSIKYIKDIINIVKPKAIKAMAFMDLRIHHSRVWLVELSQ